MTKLFVGTRAEFYQGLSEKSNPGAKSGNAQLASRRIAEVIR